MKKAKIIVPSMLLLAIAFSAVILTNSVQAASEQTNVKNFKMNREPRGLALSDEQKAEMEIHRAEMEAKREAADKAIESGDYSAWLTAVGVDCPMTQKINADNFSQLIELHSLQKQVGEKRQALGLEMGPKNGFGRHK